MEWIIIIVAIVLLLFGAKKIPDFARNIGKASGEFKRGKQMVEMEMRETQRMANDDLSPMEGRSPSRKSSTSDAGLWKAAVDLGIDTDGKSDEEVRHLIRERVSEA
jgi:sec-independent protein translocase protein TatA